MPPWADPGQRRGVVGQGDARELRDGTAGQGAAPRQQPGNRRQLAGGSHVQQVVTVRAVPEQADDVAGTRRTQVRERPAVNIKVKVNGSGSGSGDIGASLRARHGGPGQQRQGRRDVDDAGRAVEHAALTDPGPGQHQRCPGLTRVQRPVLTQVPAALRPVMRRAVDDHDVRRPVRIGEDRGEPYPGERVGVAVVRR